ncbi:MULTISPECIES: hypothetical protein [unclassified Nocardioides]|uniref:hypothetical protein n=1 Tax=unclassified Nocardioides TaxID=2615069 RepID=UPI000A86A0D2|nr:MULTISPECIES: hypothetical protein [unclassified Nocardioides]
MAETAPPGFMARNNQWIGSVLSVAALVVSVLLGAGLMFGTDTRGVSAILTVLTVAGGTFTVLLYAIGAMLEALTPTELWDREETEWRVGMGLPALTDADAAASEKAHRKAMAFAVLAIIVGLALSVVPAIV